MRDIAPFRGFVTPYGEAGAGFEINLSVPPVLEYEMALVRDPVVDTAIVDETIAYLCSVGRPREIYYLWRPFLRDPSDEMVLEVAVESQSTVIVTHNVKDFKGVEEKFGIRIVRPGEFLNTAFSVVASFHPPAGADGLAMAPCYRPTARVHGPRRSCLLKGGPGAAMARRAKNPRGLGPGGNVLVPLPFGRAPNPAATHAGISTCPTSSSLSSTAASWPLG